MSRVLLAQPSRHLRVVAELEVARQKTLTLASASCHTKTLRIKMMAVLAQSPVSCLAHSSDCSLWCLASRLRHRALEDMNERARCSRFAIRHHYSRPPYRLRCRHRCDDCLCNYPLSGGNTGPRTFNWALIDLIHRWYCGSDPSSACRNRPIPTRHGCGSRIGTDLPKAIYAGERRSRNCAA